MHVPGTIPHQHKKFEEKQKEKNVQLFSYISALNILINWVGNS
jgi:hypothetical protein